MTQSPPGRVASCAEAIPLTRANAIGSRRTALFTLKPVLLRSLTRTRVVIKPRLHRRGARQPLDAGSQIDRSPLRIEARLLQLAESREQIVDKACDATIAI